MSVHPALDIDAYLRRIGVTERPPLTLEGLTLLQQAHMKTVPFENLDVYYRRGVSTDLHDILPKIVERRRGGWCFEANGAFAELLTGLGFSVRRIGAAVLLGGPTDVIDHLTIEVHLEQPWLVDVGFGESFTRPLCLTTKGPQPGGIGPFEFLASPKGTTLTRHVDGVPEAQFRFKRVSMQQSDFEPASHHLQSAPDLDWSRKRFATRVLDPSELLDTRGAPDAAARISLLQDRLKFHAPPEGEDTEIPVDDDQWFATLERWFGMQVEPGPPATERSGPTP